MYNIVCRYNITHYVYIIPLEVQGRIVGIYKDAGDVQFHVRYIDNAEICIEYFYTDELRLV